MDKATKWGYFILYIKEMSIENLSEVYVKEVFAQYGALSRSRHEPECNVLNRVVIEKATCV